MKLVKYIPELKDFAMFLKNRNIISKIKRSKVTDYAALRQIIVNESIKDIFKMSTWFHTTC